MGCGSSAAPPDKADTATQQQQMSKTPQGIGTLPNAHELLRDMQFCKMDLVADNLYLGNRNGAADRDLLLKNKVECIVNATRLKPFHPEDFEYLSVEVDDAQGADIKTHFERAAGFIHDAISSGKVVFVHCEMGMSRSSSLCAAYMLLHLGWSLRRAVLSLKLGRPIVRITRSFVFSLVDLETALALGGRLDDELLSQEGIDGAASGRAESVRLLLFPSAAVIDECLRRTGKDPELWHGQPKCLAGVDASAFAEQTAPSDEFMLQTAAEHESCRRFYHAVKKECGPMISPFVK